jgi:gliding motility-associated-like protein
MSLLFTHYLVPSPGSMGLPPLSLHMTELLDSLQKDSTYCVELRYRAYNGYSVPNQNYTGGIRSCFTHKNLGVFFNKDAFLPMEYHLITQPFPDFRGYLHVMNPNGYIVNTTHWEEMRGKFVANGGERFAFFTNMNWSEDSIMQYSFQNDCHVPSKHGFILIDAVMVFKCTDTLFTAHIGNDTLLCPGETLPLHAFYEGFKLKDTVATYVWQTPYGPRYDSTIVADRPGYYEVEVTINHRFKARHGIHVRFGPEPPHDAPYLPKDFDLCVGLSERLALPDWDTTTYRWNTGANTRSIAVTEPGYYEVHAENFCWSHTESITIGQSHCGQHLWIPNAFTPDGDGLNDVFEIRGAEYPLQLWVYDRWGGLVFHSPDYQNNWRGTRPDGSPLPDGVYTYKVTYTTSQGGGDKDRNGTLTIMRSTGP